MNNGRAFPSAFGNRKQQNNSAPRTNSSMWKNRQNDEKAVEEARLAEVARRTEFNEINFPSLGGSMVEQGWGGEERSEPVRQSGNKWSELASDWKIHDIVEKQYAEIKKEQDERKKNEFGRIIPKVYIENKTLGTTRSKHEDTYEEDPYYESPPVTGNDEDSEDEGWTTVSAKPKKIRVKRKPAMMLCCDSIEETPESIWDQNQSEEY